MNANYFRIFVGIVLVAYVAMLVRERVHLSDSDAFQMEAIKRGKFIGSDNDNPQELGRIMWLRDYEKARVIAKQTSKPLFILFQEVPGCATCKTFGKTVLSDPFITEIIESHFIPVCIYNNNPSSDDAKVLKQFDEASWNNPVVRIIDSEGQDWLPALRESYAEVEMMAYLKRVFVVLAKPFPSYSSDYLKELTMRSTSSQVQIIGKKELIDLEIELAEADVPVSAKLGYNDKQTALSLLLDRAHFPFDQLDLSAAEAYLAKEPVKSFSERGLNYLPFIEFEKFTSNQDGKRALEASEFKFVPLSPWQSIRINASLSKGEDGEKFLSPRQQIVLGIIRNNSSVAWQDHRDLDFTESWIEVSKRIENLNLF